MAWSNRNRYDSDYEEDLSTQKGRRGLAGELLVGIILSGLKKKHGLRFVPSVVLPASDGNNKVQLDFVVLSKKGFFVVETKNWNCDLFCGTKDQMFWLANYNGKTVSLRNPIIQNKWHKNTLEQFTNLKFRSLVTMCNNCRLFGQTHHNVINFRQIDEYLSELTDIYTESEVADAYQEIFDLKRSYEVVSNDSIT